MGNYITFNIDDQVMGVDMINVEKVIILSKVFLIPNSAEHLEGVIKFQDSLVPVINLKTKLNLENCKIADDSSVIVIVDNYGKSGIIVDSVNDIVTIPENEIIKQIQNKFLYGVVAIDDTIINLLKTENLITDTNTN